LIREENAYKEEIPATLRDLLTGKIDQLGPTRETAQLASVIGRSFDYRLIEKVSLKDAALLLADLDQLISAGVLHVQLVVGNPHYVFHHALVRDAAYESIDPRVRAEMHFRIVETLEREFGDAASHQPEILAQHWGEAGEYRKASDYGIISACNLLERSLYLEAIAIVNQAIEWARRIEDQTAQIEYEIKLHQLLQPALMATLRYSSEPVLQSIRRSEELNGRLPFDSGLHFQIYWGTLTFYMLLPEYDKFEQYLNKAYEFASDAGSCAALKVMEGHRAYSGGNFARAVSLLDESIRLYDTEKHRDHARRFGHDTRIFALATKSLVLTMMGLTAEAGQSISEAQNWAEELKSTHSLAMVKSYRIGCYHYCGDLKRTREAAGELTDFCQKHDTLIWLFAANVLGGWAENDLERTVSALSSFERMGIYQFASYWNSAAAEIEIRKGMHESALARIDTFLTQAHKVKELFYIPELYRLKAACTRLMGRDAKTSLEDLHRSIALAREIGAALTEFRCYKDMVDNPSSEQERQEAHVELDRLTHRHPDLADE